MQDLPEELWALIAVQLGTCDDLRSITCACRDVCSLQSVSRKTQCCGVTAFSNLSSLCPTRHDFDYVLLPHYVSAKLFQHVYESKYKTIVWSLAVQRYVLSSGDLAHLKDCTGFKVYFLPDVLQAAVERWGSVAGLEKARLQILAKEAAQQQQKLDRQDEIEKCLALKGLALRSDSRLCAKYIQDGIGSPEHIANVMLEMDWLHKHTNYKACLIQVVLSLAHTFSNVFPVSSTVPDHRKLELQIKSEINNSIQDHDIFYDESDDSDEEQAIADSAELDRLYSDLQNASTTAKMEVMSAWKERKGLANFPGPSGLLQYC